jgi:hypothetical protein
MIAVARFESDVFLQDFFNGKVLNRGHRW